MRLAVLGEVPRHVIDHSIRAQGSHELEVLGVAHRGDVSAEVPGQLHHRGADGPRRAIGYGPPDGQHIVEVARPIPTRMESPTWPSTTLGWKTAIGGHEFCGLGSALGSVPLMPGWYLLKR